MIKSRIPRTAHAHSYKSHEPKSPIIPGSNFAQNPKSGRKGIYIASGLFIYALTTYSVYLYTSLNADTSSTTLPSPESDVSFRYDNTASHFDADVSFIERVSGINGLRRKLVSQAKGDVLEVCAGTGRNILSYDLGKVEHVTFVDQSGPMMEVAKRKWQAIDPKYEKANWYTQSVMHPLAISNPQSIPKEGFSTIIQTMGVCSTQSPSAALARLGTLAHPTQGKILLLEHGRSYYSWINWILDKSAARHADKHGCWFNRDVGKILEDSGLTIEKVERSQFGTVWYVEARPPS